MAIPEGFTRSQLGLPEEDNRRTIERPSTGIWHILIDPGSGPEHATIFVSALSGKTLVYADGYFHGGPDETEALLGRFAILQAPDEAIEALRRGGYEFADRRS